MMDREAPESYLRELDETCTYPYALHRRWVDMGLLGLPFAERDGGLGRPVMDVVVVAEEIARKGYDLAGAYGVPVFIGLNVAEFGTEQQRAQLLPELFEGRRRFSIALTEPDAGSDATALRTRATLDGDTFVVNGEK